MSNVGKELLNKFVLVRTYSAGVHFGTLVDRDKTEVLLENAKRIWSWEGAFSLSEIAKTGLNLEKSKISVSVEKIILTEATEVIVISDTSNLNKIR